MRRRSWIAAGFTGKVGHDLNLRYLGWSAVAGALALLLVKPASAENLSEVRRALGELRGLSPIAAHIEMEVTETNGKKKKEYAGSVVVEDDGTTLRMLYSKAELAKLAAEQREADDKGNESIGAPMVERLLNRAPHLLRELEGATVNRSEATRINGIDVTLLEVALERKARDEDKYLKSLENILTLWIGPDRLPLRAERRFNGKGRFLVFSFQLNSKDTFHFAHVGDRLVVTRHTSVGSGSGMGETGGGTATTTVTVRR